MIASPYHKVIYTVEADHRTLSPSAQQALINAQTNEGIEVDQAVMELPADIFGLPRAAAGNWASCIRIIDPLEVSYVTS